MEGISLLRNIMFWTKNVCWSSKQLILIFISIDSWFKYADAKSNPGITLSRLFNEILSLFLNSFFAIGISGPFVMKRVTSPFLIEHGYNELESIWKLEFLNLGNFSSLKAEYKL